MEHAPKGRRGLYGAFPTMGTPAGMLCANAVFLGTSSLLGEESFMAWGWRVPFLLSIVLVVWACTCGCARAYRLGLRAVFTWGSVVLLVGGITPLVAA